MKLFDANAWIGTWPFSLGPALDARGLARELRRHGIDRALVSPLAAVLAAEPGAANRALLRETRGVRGLWPVPVINPALANWREEFAAVAADSRVRAVRVLPGYHGYKLTARALAHLADACNERGLRLIVQARLIDERHEYHAMTVQPLAIKALGAWLAERPQHAVVVCGLLRSEIQALAPVHPNLHADLTLAEWLDPVPELRKKAARGQLVFGSGTPLFMPGAQAAKLATARGADRSAVASDNLAAWLEE